VSLVHPGGARKSPGGEAGAKNADLHCCSAVVPVPLAAEDGEDAEDQGAEDASACGWGIAASNADDHDDDTDCEAECEERWCS